MAAEVDRRGRASERGAELRRAPSRRPRSPARPRCPGSRLRTAASEACTRAPSTASTFVSATTPCSIAEQTQDLQVLVGLRLRPLPRVDDEQEEVDPRRARDHRANESLVPRDVDDREARPVRELELRVAERDRDSAPLLLGQPVGVGARQRLDEAGLAVVDVAGRPEREPRAPSRGSAALDRCCDRVDLLVGDRAAVEERPPLADEGHDRCRRSAQRGGQVALERTGRARQLEQR